MPRFHRFPHMVLAAAVAALVLVPGCGDETAPADPGGLRPLGSRLTVRISETPCCGGEATRPELLLTVATTRVYNVPVPWIAGDMEVDGGIVRVTLHGLKTRYASAASAPVLVPPAPQPGPAVWSRPVPMPDGNYRLVLIYRTERDEYDLSISRDRIDLRPVHLDLTEPVALRYWRAPENSFIYRCSAAPTAPTGCQEVLDLLDSRFGLEEFTYPPDGENGLTAWGPEARVFLYPEGTTFDEIEAYFYANVYPLPGGVILPVLWILDWRGSSIYVGPIE